MIDLQAVYTYVYNTCLVLTDPTLLSADLSRSLSLDVSRIIASSSSIGIPPSFLIAVCYLIIYPSPAVSRRPCLYFSLIDKILSLAPVVFFLLHFISLLLPAHYVTECNVDTLLDTIRNRSLLQFTIHLVLSLLPGTTGPVSLVSVRTQPLDLLLVTE
jgi:hypothetical protein